MSGARALVVGLVAVSSMTLAACGTGGQGSGDWREGEQRGPWTLVFDGYGEASGDADRVRLGPRVAADHDVTHGALAVDATAPADVRMTGTVTTVEQLREGTPNPWEVGWMLWRYTDPDHFYALAVKPNGWELSKQDPAYPGKQRFLASGDTPVHPTGRGYRVEIVAVGPTMTVRVDDTVLATVTDGERPYLTGGVGLYTEDAVVDFTRVRTERTATLPAWATVPVPASTGSGRGGASGPTGTGSTS